MIRNASNGAGSESGTVDVSITEDAGGHCNGGRAVKEDIKLCVGCRRSLDISESRDIGQG
jgi:hypothetical protein